MKHLKAAVFDLGDTLIHAEDASLKLVDGVRDCLDALHREIALYVATNNEYGVAVLALEKTDLRRYFGQVFTPNAFGVTKPNPVYFRRLVEKLALKPDQIVMIGDSFRNDIEGAKACGLRTIWLADEAGAAPAGADHVITTMRDAAEAVRRIDERAAG